VSSVCVASGLWTGAWQSFYDALMPRIVPITGVEDPGIAPFREVRERDLVGRDGHFIAEGEIVLRKLIASPRHRAVSLLLAEKRLERLAPVLAELPPDVPVFTAPQELLDTIAGFHLHRGMLALGQRLPDEGADALLAALPEKALVVVLVGIANHDNMGGLFRNAAGFGVDAVLLDPTSCDPLYRKAIRVSAGAVLDLPFARVDEDMLSLLDRHGLTAVSLSPSGREELADYVPPRRAALLFGAEGRGLPREMLERTTTLRIAMSPGFDSLNVATSSGIALYHFARGMAELRKAVMES